jgi:hypothetical protein
MPVPVTAARRLCPTANPRHDREGFASNKLQILRERKILRDHEAMPLSLS